MSSMSQRETQIVLAEMDRDTKLRLAAFVCLYAWADKAIHANERKLLQKLVVELQLPPQDVAKAEGWTRTPPPLENARIESVPVELRAAFLEQASRVIASDGKLDPVEIAALDKLKKAVSVGATR